MTINHVADINYIFSTWEHGAEEFWNFVETLNEFHPTIKFAGEWSQNTIHFWMLQFL